MIQLTHLTGSRAGQVDQNPKAVVRLGRGADCDIRFDGAVDRTVSTHHAEIRFDGNDGYVLVDTQSSNGTLVNGSPVQQHRLRPGDVIFLGGQVGPQLRFDVANAPSASPRKAAPAPKAPSAKGGQTADDDVLNAAQAAVAKARQSRQAAGGAAPSGQTMFMMVDAINQVVEKKQSNFRRNFIILGSVAAVIIAVLVGWNLHLAAQLNGKVDKKKDLDGQIAKLQTQIEIESDDAKRQELVDKLNLLTGQAEQVTADLESTDKGKKAEEKAGVGQDDFVDQQIKLILHDFEADTYSIPSNFRQAVEKDLDGWKKSGALQTIWNRRRQYWPQIEKAFHDEGVPDEMAYVAWQESEFDPRICSWVGARGMWQFMPATARRYGLRVDHCYDHCKPNPNAKYCDTCCTGEDDRTDPYLASKAAAQYLGDLLAQFGMDSFMLAIASYNKGEDGMRSVLCKNKLRRHSQRDFWNLYYLRYLPQETLEYVPHIIAAAIIGRNPEKFGLTP